GVGPVAADAVGTQEALDGAIGVMKFGAATGLTRGRVQGLFNLLNDPNDEHPFRIDGVLEVESEEADGFFCDEGDSGSMVWETDRPPGRAVGLLVADTFMHRGYVPPAARILARSDTPIATSP